LVLPTFMGKIRNVFIKQHQRGRWRYHWGSKVYVEGRLRTRKWQDQNGQDRYTTEIQGDVLQMLDSRSDRQSGGYAPAAQPTYPSQAQSAPRATPASKPAAEAPMDNFDDDIPF